MKEIKEKAISFCVHLLSSFGLLWLIIEIAAFWSSKDVLEKIKSFWWLFAVVGLIYAFKKVLPPRSITLKVPNRDSTIKVCQKDILQIKGSLVIPINNSFVVNKDGQILKSNSILAQIVKMYFNSRPEYLQTDLDKELESEFYKSYKDETSDEYEIGTVVPIIKDDKKFYFLANTKTNRQNKAYCDDEMFEKSINELWVYLSDCASKEDFIVPLFGTGNGRLNFDRFIVYQEILMSFLSSLSSKSYAKSLTICFNPTDVHKYAISFDEVTRFAEAKVIYQNYSKSTSKGTNAMSE